MNGHQAMDNAASLIDAVSDYAFYLLDPDGIVTSRSPAATQVPQILGRHFACVYTAEDQQAGVPAQDLDSALREGSRDGEGWRVRNDGTPFWANFTIDRIRDPMGKHVGFAKIIRPVSGRRLIEEARDRSDEPFKMLVQGVTDYAIYMLDPAGRVTNWNPGAQIIKGYTSQEIVGQSFAVFYSEEDRLAGEPQRTLDIALRQGRFEAEAWRIRKDGSRFWASVVVDPIRSRTGTVIGFAKITRDITEAKGVRDQLEKSRDELRQSNADLERRVAARTAELTSLNETLSRTEKRFRQVVEGAPNAIVMINAGGLIEMVNAQTERLFGYPRAELLGQQVEMLMPARFRDRHPGLRTGFFHQPTSRPMGAAGTLFGQRKDGNQFEMEIALSPVEVDGETMVLATVIDISERIRLETQMRQMQKMEVLGRLAAGVSHDFNNLLQVIIGGVDNLRDEEYLSKAAKAFLDMVEGAARRGAYLTHHLLSYSRMQVLTVQPLDVGKVMESLGIVLSRTLPSNITVHIAVASPLGRIRTDRGQLETALINLCINAGHAMPNGGTLRLDVRSAEAEPFGELGQGRHVVFAVTDTGTGMTPEVLACAFDPFFTTKGLDGTGLGLAMVQGFSRQSGGDVRVSSTLGKGSTFEIWLPEDASGIAPATVAGTPRPTHAGHVLLVDDSPDIVLTVTAFLIKSGLTARHASNGQEALAMLEAGEIFDLLITDYMMPGSNGLELVRKVRRLLPDIPALIISGYSDVTDLMSGLPNAALLQKPFNRDQLIKQVTIMITGKADAVV